MNVNEKFAGFNNAERPSVGLAMIFDISGFTKFFNKPGIHFYITDYINGVIDSVETVIWGGDAYWLDDTDSRNLEPLQLKPIMQNFLGDGMLYVWEDDENRIMADDNFKVVLLNRLWTLQTSFSEVNKLLNKKMPVGDLPLTIKVGMAQGSVFKITDSNGFVDCIGPCINLASRLVKYCPELNFIASARLNISEEQLEDSGYVKKIAIDLRSFESEIVIVDKDDFEQLNEVDKERLFRFLPS